MKKSLIMIAAFFMALCLALVSAAVPGAVNVSDVLTDNTENENATLSSEILGTVPEATVTVKELMAAAVRLHNSLNGGSLSYEYDFNTYYDYAVDNGIFADSVYASEDQIPTRAQVVTALYNAVNGKIALAQINQVLDMIDADPNADYYVAAETFMKAGIVYGYDKYGSFKPSNTVKRYELGLMIDRLLDSSNRVTKEYVVYSSNEPFYLIDDFTHDSGANGWSAGGSGWRIDYTGSTEIGTLNNYSYVLRDFAVDDDMSTTRKIHVQENGELVFESVYAFESGNTVAFSFFDTDGNVIATAGWEDGYAYIGSYTSSIKSDNVKQPAKSTDVNQFNQYMAGKIRTRIILDLDVGTYKLWMGKNYIGEQPLTGANLAKVKIHTGISEISSVSIYNTHLFKNYRVNDVFRLENQGDAPVGYEIQGNVTVERLRANADGTGEVNSMKMSVSSGNTYAKKSFKKAVGKVIMETYVLLDDTVSETVSDVTNCAYFTVKSSDVPVLTIKNIGNSWYAGTTKLDLTTPDDVFTSNVWQWLRIEADVATQTALIKINGKVAGTNIPFLVKADGFDSLEVGVEATEAGVVWFDDIEVYETFTHIYDTDNDPDNDYCPEPVPLDTGDYVINMSVCNLWRNGTHYGWDWIRPYAELEPAIGYYDEGNPEAMDWEIKYLTEHGVSNYMTCWYPISGGVPLKKPRMIDAIHDGYFNAKYSDMMTFSLMFENTGYTSNAQRDDFKNVVFPLWMDWYFSDPRYCRITDGGNEYIFITIYSYLNFLDMCSSTNLLVSNELQYDYDSTEMTNACDDAKNMFEWMEDQIIAAGYADGLIVCFGGGANTSDAYSTMAKMGGEGMIPYTWGKLSWDVETQKGLASSHMTTAKNSGIDLLTLATPGFNDIGWTTLRTGYMTTENFDEMLQWHKDRMGNSSVFDQASWKSKFITLDTWNEYGEGHYLFPTAEYNEDLGYGGFGYLDVVAEQFGGVVRDSDAAEANNTYPTALQQARIGRLYPIDMDHYIRRDMIVESEVEEIKFITLGGRDFTVNNTTTGNVLKNGKSGPWNGNSIYPPYFQYDSSRKCWYGTTTSSCTTANPARIDLDADSQFNNINMDDVSYIRLKLGTSSGGSTGKIYFKNTTDTSDHDNYSEDRKFTFNTYADGDENCTYLINVKNHKLWTGTLAGIMLECTNEVNETVYIYDLELITEDDSTKKPQIYVDSQKYNCKDYGEIRSYDRKEIYIAPTDEGGLYKLLHIVYDWSRNTKILKLDTPDGTTFEFDYNNKSIKKNGTLIGTDSKLVIYDGAPVIPLLYVLNNAGFVYSYDFTNKIVDVTVAESFKLVYDITNGNAEDLNNANAFTDYNNEVSSYVTVAVDPEDSSNHAWKYTSEQTQAWNYISTPVDFVAGKTYTLDFDVYFDSVGANGAAPSGGTGIISINPRYSDGSGTVDHSLAERETIQHQKWTHVTRTFTINDTYVAGTGQMAVFMNPVDSIGCTYYIDNVVLRCDPKPFNVINADAEDTTDNPNDNVGFFSDEPLTIETESGGNHYWLLTSNETARSWSYIRHNTTYEKGVTYYYSVKVKVGQDGNKQNVTGARVTLNARYYDSVQLGNTGEWYSHTQDLRNENGQVIYMSTGDDWATATGSFTISQGYQPAGGPNGNIPEEITLYCNPVGNAGVSFMIDDFQISTDPDAFK